MKERRSCFEDSIFLMRGGRIRRQIRPRIDNISGIGKLCSGSETKIMRTSAQG